MRSCCSGVAVATRVLFAGSFANTASGSRVSGRVAKPRRRLAAWRTRGLSPVRPAVRVDTSRTRACSSAVTSRCGWLSAAIALGSRFRLCAAHVAGLSVNFVVRPALALTDLAMTMRCVVDRRPGGTQYGRFSRSARCRVGSNAWITSRANVTDPAGRMHVRLSIQRRGLIELFEDGGGTYLIGSGWRSRPRSASRGPRRLPRRPTAHAAHLAPRRYRRRLSR